MRRAGAPARRDVPSSAITPGQVGIEPRSHHFVRNSQSDSANPTAATTITNRSFQGNASPFQVAVGCGGREYCQSQRGRERFRGEPLILPRPLPLLDGGRIIFCVLEKIHRPLVVRLDPPLTLAGWALVWALMAYVTVQDLGTLLA
jgi:hypothetical protein